MKVVDIIFFFKKKTAFEMRISDWSSDVCSSDLASSPASYHWLSAPDAPAPSAIARIEEKPSTGWTCPGAASSPHSAVNTTSDITRGLVSANRSRQSAGSLISPLVRLWVISNLEPLFCVHQTGKAPGGERVCHDV